MDVFYEGINFIDRDFIFLNVLFLDISILERSFLVEDFVEILIFNICGGG